jgi:Rod binding domain-containing protein
MSLPVAPTGAAGAPAPAAERRAPVRDAGAAKAGEAFERALLGQLTKTLAESAFGGADGPSSVAAGAYRDLLPDALTDALVEGGGIGLARVLDRGPLA